MLGQPFPRLKQKPPFTHSELEGSSSSKVLHLVGVRPSIHSGALAEWHRLNLGRFGLTLGPRHNQVAARPLIGALLWLSHRQAPEKGFGLTRRLGALGWLLGLKKASRPATTTLFVTRPLGGFLGHPTPATLHPVLLEAVPRGAPSHWPTPRHHSPPHGPVCWVLKRPVLPCPVVSVVSCPALPCAS